MLAVKRIRRRTRTLQLKLNSRRKNKFPFFSVPPRHMIKRQLGTISHSFNSFFHSLNTITGNIRLLLSQARGTTYMSDECTYLTRPRLESFILIKSFISPPPSSSWPLSQQQALMQGLKIKGFPREDESVLSMAKALRVGWADQRPPAACLVS